MVEYKYLVIKTTDVNTHMLEQSVGSDPLLARYRLDGSELILKFISDKIPFEVTNRSVAGPFSASEMRSYIGDNSVDWEVT